MALWTDLPALIGNTDLKIELWGKYGQQMSPQNPKGRSAVVSSYDLANQTVYLGETAVQGGAVNNTIELYWLPWKDGEITRASIKELNDSGCKYFMTSTFSGCRFVATETEVSHVAFSQAGFGFDTAARNASEQLSRGGARPFFRRTLSITSSGERMASVNDQQSTYGAGHNGQMWTGNAVVLGYRVDLGWNFKALIYAGGLRFWFNLD